MEHRWGDRIDCNVVVKLLAHPASVAWGRIRNASVSGGFIETQLRVRPLSIVSLRRATGREPGRDGNVIRAIVVRRDAGGVGVEWMEGSSNAVAAILQEAALHGVCGPLRPQPWSAQRRPMSDACSET